jgi:uncharacterized phage protein (TIGR01671 family)
MNRPIEFRVWTGTKMEYNIVAGKDGAFYALIDPRDSACLSPTSKYQPETPRMQFTGLFDNSGRKIYEGDILQIETDISDGPYLSEVKYEFGYFFCFKNKYEWAVLAYYIGFCTVVGNIFENPDLLLDNSTKTSNLEKITMPELIEDILQGLKEDKS